MKRKKSERDNENKKEERKHNNEREGELKWRYILFTVGKKAINPSKKLTEPKDFDDGNIRHPQLMD